MLAKVLMGLGLLLGCAGGPDELAIGYGHLFTGDSMLEAWPITNEDSSWFTIGFVWKLKPTEVVFQGSPPPATVAAQAPTKTPTPPQSPEAEEASQITDAVEAFDAYDWLTRVLLAGLAGWLLFIYRRQIGRLIPGGNNNNKKNNCK